ncbi:hypothetical protein AB0B07_16105 [Streptomyces sioyaensis]|uniref:hypothetical protein n=1 Tax=Streptomyces sioyaensis TaxID=67364 RepID=UPI0033FBA0B4
MTADKREAAFFRILYALRKAIGVDRIWRAPEVHGHSCPAIGRASRTMAMQKGTILND